MTKELSEEDVVRLADLTFDLIKTRHPDVVFDDDTKKHITDNVRKQAKQEGKDRGQLMPLSRTTH